MYSYNALQSAMHCWLPGRNAVYKCFIENFLYRVYEAGLIPFTGAVLQGMHLQVCICQSIAQKVKVQCIMDLSF